MSDRLILEALVSTAWCMEERRLREMASVVLRHSDGVRLDADAIAAIVAGRDERQEKRSATHVAGGDDFPYQVVGSVAVVPITGIIRKRASMVNQASGPRGTSVESVRARVQDARENPDVGGVLLLVDSPGGSTDGMKQLADELFAMRGDGGPPVWAIIDGLGASAAFYQASQASKVLMTPDGEAGSIGTYMVMVDSSRAAENEGYKVHLIKAGDVKGAGTPGVAIDQAALDHWQSIVNKINSLFVEAVGRGRGLSGDALNTVVGGKLFFGKDAVDAGLVDGISTVEATVKEMNRLFPAPAKAGRGASTPARGVIAGDAGRSTSMKDKDQSGAAAVVDTAGGTQGTTTTTGGGAAVAEQPKDVVGKIDPTAINTAVNDALAKSHERAALIEAACKPFMHVEGVSKLRDKALFEDRTVSADAVKAKVLDLVTAGVAPVGSVELSLGSSGWDREKKGHEVLLLTRLRSDLEHKISAGGPGAAVLARSMGFDSPELFTKTLREARGNGLGRLRLLNVAERFAAAGLNGAGFGQRRVFTDDREIFAASFGHSTSDFPLLTANVQQKVLQSYFDETETIWQKIAKKDSASDFKTKDLLTMSKLPSLLLKPEGDKLKEATFDERREQIRAYTYGRKFSVTRELIVNDDLSAIAQILQTWGIVAKRTPDILVITILTANAAMSDGVALFHADHRNLEASGTALSVASFSSIVKKMKRQVSFGAEAVPIQVKPKTLLVPSELWDTAIKVTTSVIDPTAGNTNSNVPNVVQRLGVDPVDTSLLTDATAWYVFGDPSLMPALVVTFLNGSENPIVTPVGNGSILGQDYEVIYDVGAKSNHFESVYKNPGA